MAAPFDNDNNSTRGVGLQELLRRHRESLIAEGIHSWLPARVETYDASKQMVSCQILVKDFHRNETGALVVASVPIITDVPVGFYSAGGFAITSPIVAGTTLGRLFFAERSLDRWLAGTGQEVDPELYSRFNLTDAVFEPGGLPFGAALANVPSDRMRVGLDSNSAGIIEIRGDGSVVINAGTNGAARTGDDVTASAALATWALAIQTALTAAGHSSATLFATAAGLAGGLATIHGGSTTVKVG